MAPHGTVSELKAFNDWPNDLGFETFQEQTKPVELHVSGKIPAYAAGVLYVSQLAFLVLFFSALSIEPIVMLLARRDDLLGQFFVGARRAFILFVSSKNDC